MYGSCFYSKHKKQWLHRVCKHVRTHAPADKGHEDAHEHPVDHHGVDDGPDVAPQVVVAKRYRVGQRRGLSRRRNIQAFLAHESTMVQPASSIYYHEQ